MATKKKTGGLGKGLDALFGELDPVSVIEVKEEGTSSQGVALYSIDMVKPNKTQPRKTFDPQALQDLAASIKEHGIIQPLIVRPSGKGYEIVAGERRYRAAREAGLKEVPCIVRELDDRQNMLFAIIENMQREDLNPIEEAEGLHAMVETYGLTQEEISKSVGKSRPYISNSMRLLGLEPEVLEMVRKGELSAGHGRTLLGCKTEEEQKNLAKKTVKNGLSVRELEETVSGKKKNSRNKPRPRTTHPDVLAVENTLSRKYGTKVKLLDKGKSGKIEFTYYSQEEREHLIELLQGE